MAFQIEKGVPISVHGNSRPGGVTDTLMKMEVNDSVVFDHDENIVMATISRLAKRTGRKFTTRAAENGRRVWRIE